MQMKALPQDLGVGPADDEREEGDDTAGIQGLQNETTTLWNVDGSDEPSFLKTRRRYHRGRHFSGSATAAATRHWQATTSNASRLLDVLVNLNLLLSMARVHNVLGIRLQASCNYRRCCYMEDLGSS